MLKLLISDAKFAVNTDGQEAQAGARSFKKLKKLEELEMLNFTLDHSSAKILRFLASKSKHFWIRK